MVHELLLLVLSLEFGLDDQLPLEVFVSLKVLLKDCKPVTRGVGEAASQDPPNERSQAWKR